MLPSIFLSSTIADLHYLRDGLRDAIDELAYRPVMSEYGEIGYINPTTAAESCFRTVKQCQMVVLIVGRRYGAVDSDGLSVTHREYLTAKNEGLPTITFVEPDVLNYKEVYDSEPNAELWNSFPKMDHPRKTFQLLTDINNSESYNAILPFSSVSDAKRKLKRQIAEFVGDRLVDVISPINQQVRDILAEVRTMRNMVVHKEGSFNDLQTRRYLAITRYLLNDNCKEYRDLLAKLFKDLDTATTKIVSCDSFKEVIDAAKWRMEEIETIDFSPPVYAPPDGAKDQTDATYTEPPEARIISGSYFGNREGYQMYADNRIRIAKKTVQRFDSLQRAMHAKANMT